MYVCTQTHHYIYIYIYYDMQKYWNFHVFKKLISIIATNFKLHLNIVNT